jgi:hypothetical protein
VLARIATPIYRFSSCRAAERAISVTGDGLDGNRTFRIFNELET